MVKTSQTCPMCNHPLSFRKWSNRYSKTSRYREALADCKNGCGKFGLRYFDGVPTSEPYQVRQAAKKTKSVSARIEPDRYNVIIEKYGTFQKFVDAAV